jgi:hypothetical protein
MTTVEPVVESDEEAHPAVDGTELEDFAGDLKQQAPATQETRRKRMKENKQDQATDKNAALIARLRDQKSESEQLEYQQGYEDGTWYAQHSASYDEFVRLEEAVEEAEMERGLSVLDVVRHSEQLESTREHVSETVRESGVINEEAFWDGWMAGVMSVWKQVKNNL